MPIFIIYLVALIEGFSTLAVEIIAIRLATPIVGSSIILTSIFLGVILLALSAGYYVGGIIASKHSPRKLIFILGCYLVVAGLYYLFISFSAEKWLLQELLTKTQDYVLTLFVVAISLFFLPVFIASQTLPILTELIDETSKGKAAGKILFISTIGSFLGSVLTSTVLFQTLGVRTTGVVVACSLLVATAILRHKEYRRWALLAILGAGGTRWYANEGRALVLPSISYQFDSAYQEIVVREISYKNKPALFFMTNGAFSSAIDPETMESPFEYIIQTIELTEKIRPRKVLVIGTAWFTFPYQIAQFPYVEQIDAVDIDPRVKPIAEEHFLKTELPEKITFYPQSARFFLYQALQQKKKYDLIFVDAYNGKSLPDELTTKEFFTDLRKLSSNNQIVFNFILDRKLESDLAQRLLATAHTVFPSLYYRYATSEPSVLANVLVSTTRNLSTFATYQPIRLFGIPHYTDDRRSTEIDTVKLYR